MSLYSRHVFNFFFFFAPAFLLFVYGQHKSDENAVYTNIVPMLILFLLSHGFGCFSSFLFCYPPSLFLLSSKYWIFNVQQNRINKDICVKFAFSIPFSKSLSCSLPMKRSHHLHFSSSCCHGTITSTRHSLFHLQSISCKGGHV